jgi:hypothetical protein
MFAVGRRIFSALSVGSKWNERHESNCPLSPTIYALPHRPSDNMGLRDKFRNLLHLPPKDRRARSEVGSEAGPIVDPSEVVLAAPRLAESTPDLGIGPTSVPSTSQNPESSGMRTTSFRAIRLVTIGNTGSSDRIESVLSQSQGHSKSSNYIVDPTAAYEKKPSWKSTAYATTKLAIDMVKESSDVFPPLKSVVGGLSAILQHCDVRSIYSTPHRS